MIKIVKKTDHKKNKLLFGLSPLGLLTLTACGGGDSDSVSIGGHAVAGPLKNALAFLDYNFNKTHDPKEGEPSDRTDEDGLYSLSPLPGNASYQIVVKTDDQTIDGSTGGMLSGVTLTAKAGSKMVTPATTLMDQGNLTAKQVADVLDLPETANPLTYNPYAEGVDPAEALKFEQKASQIMSIMEAFSGVLEGAGASADDAFAATMEAVVEIVKLTSDAGGTLDLKDAVALTSIKDAVLVKADANPDISYNAASFAAVAADTVTAVENMNTMISEITDTNLKSDATKNILQTAQAVATEVKTAALAGDTTKITSNNREQLEDSVDNKAPNGITLSNNSISEAETSLLIDTLNTTDVDQADGAAFTYEISGDDADKFTIDTSGVLSLKDEPDFETQQSYSVTIVSTDSGFKSFAKPFTINVENVDDGATTGTVTVTGTAVQGSTLSATHDLTDPDGVASVAFQWLADGVAISGATGDSYTLTASELGKKIVAKVTATDNANATTTISSEATSFIASNPDIPLSDHTGASFEWVHWDYQTYDGAKLGATGRGGELASITSAEEQLDLVAVAYATYTPYIGTTLPLNSTAEDGGGAVYAWLGANDITTENSFVWESGEAFSYENFGSIEPDNYEVVDGDGNVRDQDGVAIAAGSWPNGASDADAYGLQTQWNDISVDNTLSYFVEFDTVDPTNAVTVITINYANYAKWDAIEAEMDAAGDAFDISFDAMANRLDDTGDQTPSSNNGTTTTATSTALLLTDDVTGSVLAAEFSNFVPTNIADLTTAFDSIDPADNSTWVIDGGLSSITFTDANGTDLWEIAHTDGTTDAYTLTDFQAETGQVNAIKLEGDNLSNQWSDYMALVDALNVADGASDEGMLDALQEAAVGNFDLNKISIMAKDIAAPKLSLEFETDSVELTMLDLSVKLTAIGSTSSTTFDIDALQDLNNLSGPVDATVADLTAALSGAAGGSITFNHATHGELMDLTIESFADADKEIERIDLLPDGGTSAGRINGDNYILEDHGTFVTYFEGSNLTMSEFYTNVVFEDDGFEGYIFPVADSGIITPDGNVVA